MKNMRLVLRLEIKQPHTATIVCSTSAAVEEEVLDKMLPEIEASFKKWLTIQMLLLGGVEVVTSENLSTDDSVVAP